MVENLKPKEFLVTARCFFCVCFRVKLKIHMQARHWAEREKKKMGEVKFYRSNGTLFATIRDILGFSSLFHQGIWNFRVNETMYRADSWQGRQEVEELFGESVDVFLANAA